MAFLLRKIRKAKWYKHQGVPWLDEGELQADALEDIATKGNELSVWYIEDDESNLEEVVTALAASGDVVANLDYALFDLQLITTLNIKIRQSPGITPDDTVNALWHRDLYNLSASKIMGLADMILTQAQIRRVPKKKLLAMIAQAVSTGRIDRRKLRPRMAAKIENFLLKNAKR
ncbi:MAG: hypothetical protein ACPGWR_01305 [Ardenticatenaceae bacterium]